MGLINDIMILIKSSFDKRGFDEADKSARRLQAHIRAAKGAFLGWGLSVMFFGMAMKRVFDSIWKAASKTFNDVIHSTEGAITSFDLLEGSLKYLQFTIGEALEPVVAYLIPIIDAIQQWASDHPKLTAAIVAGGVALGGFLMVLGQVALGIQFGIMPIISSLWEMFSGLFPTLAGSIGTILMWVTGIILAAVILWQTNFGGFRDFVSSTFGEIWAVIKNVFSRIFDIFATAWTIITALFEGDFGTFFTSVEKLLGQLLSLILTLVSGIGIIMYNTLVFAFNLVVDTVSKIFLGLISYIQQKATDLLLWFIDWARKIPDPFGIIGKSLDTMETNINRSNMSFQKMLSTAQGLAENMKGEYITGATFENDLNNLNNTLGVTQPTPETVVNNNVNVNVELDGNQIANSISSKILTGITSNTTGG